MHDFCTYFDSRYLLHGLTMYRSLKRNERDFRLFVLCLDEPTFEFLAKAKLDRVFPLALGELERSDPALAGAKANRGRAEYYFTLTPCLPLYIMNRFERIESVTYLDADLYFYSALDAIREELGGESILIIGHRFPPADRETLEHFGKFNVGYLTFKNDERGRECLGWWRERCIEWCRDVVEEGRYADQKYLDEFPRRFGGVVELRHRGANLARWNCANYELKLGDGGLLVDGEPLIFHHFNNFRIVNRWIFDPEYANHDVKRSMPADVRRWLYHGYARELRETWRWASALDPGKGFDFGSVRRRPPKWTTFARRLFAHDLLIAAGPFVV